MADAQSKDALVTSLDATECSSYVLTMTPTTLADLQEQAIDVFCWCNRCGHWAILPTAALVAQMGPGLPVPLVARRLVCTGCGTRDVATRPAWPSGGVVSRHD